MKHIFVVDDEKRIRELIEMYLKKEGYRVTSFENAENVLGMLAEKDPDLIILDIMMPGMDGLELCTHIRKTSDVPIIFVSARSEELDRILGLELGADDYLPKPFSPRELMVRIKTILKRTQKDLRPFEKAEVLTINDFELDTTKRIARAGNSEITFTIKEYDVMELFLRNPGIPMSREQIIETVWGYDYDGYDRNVDDTVKRLRKKLKAAKSDLEIKTVWGYGYRVDKDE